MAMTSLTPKQSTGSPASSAEENADLRAQLKAMTEDRDLWRFEHEGDCPVQLILEGTREELAATRAQLAALRVERDDYWRDSVEFGDRLHAAREERDNLHGIRDALEVQLKLARVERDQAWNEAIEKARMAALADLEAIPQTLVAAEMRFDGGSSEAAAKRIANRIERLARPIPAEKPE